jgi:hypothetical protein
VKGGGGDGGGVEGMRNTAAMKEEGGKSKTKKVAKSQAKSTPAKFMGKEDLAFCAEPNGRATSNNGRGGNCNVAFTPPHQPNLSRITDNGFYFSQVSPCQQPTERSHS